MLQSRGGYRVFQKGGLRPAIRNAGGWGGWGGGAVRFRPDMKSGGGGGGGLLPTSGPIQKAGGGGAVHFKPDMKSKGGGGCCPLCVYVCVCVWL